MRWPLSRVFGVIPRRRSRHHGFDGWGHRADHSLGHRNPAVNVPAGNKVLNGAGAVANARLHISGDVTFNANGGKCHHFPVG